MGKLILQTERLLLREMEDEDFSALCRMLRDPEVMYAYEHAFDDAEVDEWLDRQINRYRQDGFGLWAVILKKTGEMIGQCGLTLQDIEDRQVLEIGYLFERAYWHQGYATEAAAACIPRNDFVSTDAARWYISSSSVMSRRSTHI